MGTNDNLNELATRANEAHNGVVSNLRTAILHAKDAGDALRAAKKPLGHGSWLKWLKVHFNASPETARVYMRISEYWESHILPAMEKDEGLSIEKARVILRRPPSEIENGVIPMAKPWADMSRANLCYNFKTWLDDLPEEGVICLHQIWERVAENLFDQLKDELEKFRVKD